MRKVLTQVAVVKVIVGCNASADTGFGHVLGKLHCALAIDIPRCQKHMYISVFLRRTKASACLGTGHHLREKGTIKPCRLSDHG